ncbi:hypothetical protein QA645_41190 [Bradyrhizobium sp. CIAT3101]|uniref:PBECR3 domain-containing polyvalent protein n=1 Tax=Bradyrhizobium sp. CIAT3101 TaxID=439387 RepID=UPI0024B14A03|nr:hypothetical protein [Bradyrhizobium sp. CIAT3101]WFU80762.1 hypothetical protein QA645_41190 [Bradyrhizobium sp. CIAT3101]
MKQEVRRGDRANKPKRERRKELSLGPLPVAKINAALEMELAAGDVVFSVGAQVHAERRHSKEFLLCLPYLSGIVTDPLYIGDDHKNPGIELISRVVAADSMVLVAINLDRDEQGRYHVLSFYPVKAEKIESRRQKGFLKVAPNA